MKQWTIFVTCCFLYVFGICDVRIYGQKTNLRVHQLQIKREISPIRGGRLRFPSPKQDGDVFEILFGVFLPMEPSENGCTINESLPAFELAIKKLQKPGELFERFNVLIEYRDTKGSSKDGSWTVFDLFRNQSEG